MVPFPFLILVLQEVFGIMCSNNACRQYCEKYILEEMLCEGKLEECAAIRSEIDQVKDQGKCVKSIFGERLCSVGFDWTSTC